MTDSSAAFMSFRNDLISYLALRLHVSESVAATRFRACLVDADSERTKRDAPPREDGDPDAA